MVDWPASLPENLLQDGYNETLPKTGLRTSMDVGPAKTRQRYSTNIRPIQGQLFLTRDQAAILDDFYTNTLAGGTLSFNWINPRTEDAATLRFVTEPSFAANGIAFNAQVSLEILPTNATATAFPALSCFINALIFG